MKTPPERAEATAVPDASPAANGNQASAGQDPAGAAPPHPARALARVSDAWHRVPPGWRLALGLLMTLRVSLGVIGVGGLYMRHVTVVGGDWLNLLIRGGDPWSRFLSEWQRWDALWYQQIAEHGYRAGNATVAFSPLYPLLSRLASWPFFGNVVWGELAVSSAAFAAAMAFLYKLAAEHLGDTGARLTVLLTVLSPVGFFFLAPYTESLFLALTLATFILARRGRYWEAGMVGAAAALTRYVGVLLVLPLFVEYARRRARDGKPVDLGVFSTGLPVLALVLLMGFYSVVVGEHRSLVEVDKGWGVQFATPWHTVAASLNHIATRSDPVELMNLLMSVGFAGLCVVVVRRFPLSYAVYALAGVSMLFIRVSFFSPMMSASRYAMVLFPCLMALAWLLRSRPQLGAAVLLFSVMSDAVLFDFWTHFGFVA